MAWPSMDGQPLSNGPIHGHGGDKANGGQTDQNGRSDNGIQAYPGPTMDTIRIVDTSRWIPSNGTGKARIGKVQWLLLYQESDNGQGSSKGQAPNTGDLQP
eukprot:scaffold470_cov194-Amphora_coffeaeformis.AAC.9